MADRLLTTAQAAYLAGVAPGSFPKWAKLRGLKPQRSVRVGRSTVHVWSEAAMATAEEEYPARRGMEKLADRLGLRLDFPSAMIQ